jgi:hypothetical protein
VVEKVLEERESRARERKKDRRRLKTVPQTEDGEEQRQTKAPAEDMEYGEVLKSER